MRNYSIKSILSLLIIALSIINLNAQTQVLNDILKAKSRGTGPIMKDGVVTGYFSFYAYDKKDKEKENFELIFFDANLTKIASKKFPLDKGSVAVESAYNGENIAIKFFAPKEENYIYKIYDSNAELVKTVTRKAENFNLDYAGLGDESMEQKLQPTTGGFVNVAIKTRKGAMSKTRYIIDYFPNEKEVKGWTYNSDDASDSYESAMFLAAKDNILTLLTTKRESLMSRDMEEFVLGIDIATGKKIYENKLEDEQYSLLVLNASVNDGQITIMGSYFKKDEATTKAKSLGLAALTIDDEGKVTSRKYNSWEEDFGKHLAVNSRGKIKDVGFIYFHKFLKTADNKIFAIGESYKKQASALGIASTLLSAGNGRSNVSVVNIAIEDMYVVEFDDKFNIQKVNIYDKSKSVIEMPAGTAHWTSNTVGFYLKAYDCFDYLFTQVNKDKSSFSTGYLDYDRKAEDKGWYFGSINYKDGELTTDKVKFSTKSTWQKISPGKTGYIMITEYFRKEKKLQFRMEKINF